MDWKTLSKKLADILQNVRVTIFEFLGRFPDIEDVRLWLRKNTVTLLDKGKQFWGALYTRLVLRGEYTRRDLVVLFVVAFFVGVAGKAVAAQVITIGFDDYTLPPKETLMNLNAVQKKMIKSGGTFLENGATQASACSE